MDKLSVFGLLLGFSGILVGQLLEGGHMGILFQLAAFVIVFFGTLGAVLVQSPPRVFKTAMRMGRWVFVPPKMALEDTAKQLIEWSNLARKEGILSLEERVDRVQDPFLKKGVMLLVDGNNSDKIREIMDVEIQTWEQLHWQSARVWEAAAGYSPTIGIIGAVLGLIHVMQNLAEPSKLGAGIAVAFVATIYGVAFANLLFLPIANKLKSLLMQQQHVYELIIDGLTGISNGENPRILEAKLQCYLS